MIHIYCLVDPRNNKPFYVGATNNKLKYRLAQHIKAAQNYVAHPPFRNDTISGDKHRLIVDILNSGEKPAIITISIVPKVATNHYEHFFYCMLKSQGFTLLQLSSGFNYYENQTNLRYQHSDYKQLIKNSQYCFKNILIIIW